MRGGLVLVVVGLNVIPAHRMIREAVPHQKAAKIGMAVEHNPIEIVDLPLLKLGTAPDGGKRRQMNSRVAIRGAHAERQRAESPVNRVQVVNGFQRAWNRSLADLFDLFLHAIY